MELNRISTAYRSTSANTEGKANGKSDSNRSGASVSKDNATKLGNHGSLSGHGSLGGFAGLDDDTKQQLIKEFSQRLGQGAGSGAAPGQSALESSGLSTSNLLGSLNGYRERSDADALVNKDAGTPTDAMAEVLSTKTTGRNTEINHDAAITTALAKDSLLKSDDMQKLLGNLKQHVGDLTKANASDTTPGTTKQHQEQTKASAQDKQDSLISQDNQATQAASLNALNHLSTVATNQEAATNAAPANGTAAPDSQSIDDILALADSIVDRILVSDPKYSASSQVTISFNAASGLAQTDMTLRRDLDGLLSIIVSSSNPKSFNTLLQAKEQIIDGVQRLEKREIRFELHDTSHEQDEDSNTTADYGSYSS